MPNLSIRAYFLAPCFEAKSISIMLLARNWMKMGAFKMSTLKKKKLGKLQGNDTRRHSERLPVGNLMPVLCGAGTTGRLRWQEGGEKKLLQQQRRLQRQQRDRRPPRQTDLSAVTPARSLKASQPASRADRGTAGVTLEDDEATFVRADARTHGRTDGRTNGVEQQQQRSGQSPSASVNRELARLPPLSAHNHHYPQNYKYKYTFKKKKKLGRYWSTSSNQVK